MFLLFQPKRIVVYTFFPNNTLSQYGVNLGRRLNINEDMEYEVGLREIQFPNQIISDLISGNITFRYNLSILVMVPERNSAYVSAAASTQPLLLVHPDN